MIGMVFGSSLGGWVPTLWGVGFFSFSSIVGTTIGGILGIWLAFKLVRG
jgi:hypothetical protein